MHDSAWQKNGVLTVNGRDLEYACFGPAPEKAPTFVLLHEGLGCAALWRDFPEKLVQATGFGVFVYSRAGYGQSHAAHLPRPLNYMTLEAQDVLPLVLDAVGVQRVVLLGHSDGATIAAIYAGIKSDPRVESIVLMAPHFFAEEISLTAIEEARKEYIHGNLRPRLEKYHQHVDNAFYGWNDSWLHPDFKQWNVAEVLDSVGVPVLAIQGRQDQYGTLAQIDIITERCNSPVECLILDDCRHSPFLEHPSVVVSGIAQFVDKPVSGLDPQHA